MLYFWPPVCYNVYIEIKYSGVRQGVGNRNAKDNPTNEKDIRIGVIH